MGESSFWYRPTRVVPDQRPLNGRCCCCCPFATVHGILFINDNQTCCFLSELSRIIFKRCKEPPNYWAIWSTKFTNEQNWEWGIYMNTGKGRLLWTCLRPLKVLVAFPLLHVQTTHYRNSFFHLYSSIFNRLSFISNCTCITTR